VSKYVYGRLWREKSPTLHAIYNEKGNLKRNRHQHARNSNKKLDKSGFLFVCYWCPDSFPGKSDLKGLLTKARATFKGTRVRLRRPPSTPWRTCHASWCSTSSATQALSNPAAVLSATSGTTFSVEHASRLATLVPSLREKACWQCCSGHVSTASPGTS
jgi:hypothetical protein